MKSSILFYPYLISYSILYQKNRVDITENKDVKVAKPMISVLMFYLFHVYLFSVVVVGTAETDLLIL